MTRDRWGWSTLLAVSLWAGPVQAQSPVTEQAEGAAAPSEATTEATSGAATEAAFTVNPELGPVRLEVSLADRELRVVQADSVVRTYAVAIGKPQHPTPRGEFDIRRVIWNPGWVPPKVPWARGKRPRGPGDPQNPMGRVKLFFQEPDYYIHGTNKEESLGRAESHGCVRMANEDVVELARVVMELGGEPRPPAWFHRIVNLVRSTREVRLSKPVTVAVVK